MKKLFLALIATFSLTANAETALRVNQVGYLPDDIKAAVYIGSLDPENLNFTLSNPDVGVLAVDSVKIAPSWGELEHAARIYFSSVSTPGRYALTMTDRKTGNVLQVQELYIGKDAYSRLHINELPLNYLRQQRCGYNPAHKAECHQHDGYLVLSGENDGKHYDVRGGWHDASDYLQYLTTSANTVYQLLFAYQQNPGIWLDDYDALGHPGSNGVPDILDEARWGLEWMQRMNPEKDLYLNQIADDRDHRYAGVPQTDSVDYGWGNGLGRPVYPVSGKPYGLRDHKNRSTGEASSVGKFASSFALGAEIFAGIDSAFASDLAARSADAYAYAKARPGASQTACTISPYFYEEDNWADDMELAATALYAISKDSGLLDDASEYASIEPVTPWMGADSARHYQWYPFLNLGHYGLASKAPGSKYANVALNYMRQGIEGVARRGTQNAFLNGVPFIWCSNNLAVAFVTQAMLYRQLTGDDTYKEAETAVRDWLFGTNPWGQCMIMMDNKSGISSPRDPHSCIVDISLQGRPGRDWLVGGLVDGPVYNNIFKSLRGVHLRNEDKLAPFHGRAVYHDDLCDYSTNEPTMDGTASLTYILSQLAKE